MGQSLARAFFGPVNDNNRRNIEEKGFLINFGLATAFTFVSIQSIFEYTHSKKLEEQTEKIQALEDHIQKQAKGIESLQYGLQNMKQAISDLGPDQIRIKYAKYGADGFFNPGYDEENVLASLQSLCNGRARCQFSITNKLTGGYDPCRAHKKKLTVRYECVNKESREPTTSELTTIGDERTNMVLVCNRQYEPGVIENSSET